uniref:Uncharacterized protein n=1 Tax=Leersia perrieri TaxID=77586 RepID=A0A0D9WZT2_9ORYZ
MAAVAADFGPNNLTLGDELLQTLVSGNSVRLGELLRGETRGGGEAQLQTDGQVAINFHGAEPAAAAPARGGPSRLLGVTSNGSTALHIVASHGHPELAATTNKMGATALHEAVTHGRVEVVDLLMTRAAWLASVTTDGGVSPLYMEAASHSVQMVQALLRPTQTGQPSPASAAGPEGRTALHVAATGIKGTSFYFFVAIFFSLKFGA